MVDARDAVDARGVLLMPVRGEVRDALSQALRGGHGTTRDLALRSGVGITSAMYTLRNMVQAGEAQQLQPVRVPGVKRPVPVYGAADAGGPADAGGINWDLIDCWARWPAQA